MKLTWQVRKVLNNYSSQNPGVIANIARILMHGVMGGTGKIIVFPVDQGFEHGPARSFSQNHYAYDPAYHFQLSVDAQVSAYAAPIGMLQSCADKYAGHVPMILKMNSSNILSHYDPKAPDQAITSSVKDALRLGCSAVGFTIYPGSMQFNEMIEEVRDIIAEAKSNGLAVVIWSYPRGGEISKENETALDVVSYGAHIACVLGADIVKVKLPDERIAFDTEYYNDFSLLKDRVKKVKQSCFDGKRILLFSGGPCVADVNILYQTTKSVNLGGGDGSIVGRNIFQRDRLDALEIIKQLSNIYTDS